jgi:hypothetical protein
MEAMFSQQTNISILGLLIGTFVPWERPEQLLFCDDLLSE